MTLARVSYDDAISLPLFSEQADDHDAMMKTAKTILVVDDEPESLRSLGEVLSDMGYEVITRPSGIEALSAAQRAEACDLVITDFRMPGMNGLEFITSLRHIMPEVPVIMLTAYGDIETYFHSFSLGVFEYINKPVSKEEFERVVEAAILGTPDQQAGNGESGRRAG